MLRVLQLLGTEEAMCALEELVLAAAFLQEPAEPTPRTQEAEKLVFSAMSLSRPLLTEFSMVPAGKGKSIKGTISIFTEQAKRMNLK